MYYVDISHKSTVKQLAQTGCQRIMGTKESHHTRTQSSFLKHTDPSETMLFATILPVWLLCDDAEGDRHMAASIQGAACLSEI